MAFKYDDIMIAQAQALEAEHAQAHAELEAGRLSEDGDRVHHAAARILDIDLKLNALNVRANNYMVAQQAQPQRHPSGLSDTEIEIAKASHSGGTVEQRIQDYARNKQKLQHMRATGQYRDDQGTVRR